MSSSEPNKPNRMKLLIITSSGGGGLLQAAIAKEQELLAQDPTIEIVKKDMLKDWIWGPLGKFCIAYWNGAQKRGHVKAQIFVIRTQWIFDFFSWPNVFYQTLRTLFAENVDRIIDTQATGTSAIIKALRIFNYRRKKQVVLEKIMVDLPTKQATHYFRAIKNLSSKDKSLIRLKTIPPLLDEGESAEDFWQKTCGLSETDIEYEDFNVRQSFRKLQGKPRSRSCISIPIRFRTEEECRWICACSERGGIEHRIVGDEIQFDIGPKDRVLTILLGSQPAKEATFNYVKKFLSMAKEVDLLKVPTHLFVFCSEGDEQQMTLFQKIVDLVKKTKPYPKSFSIIPFSFQNDDVIAKLFHRSDLTCTRSGGQTAMELMAVSSGEMWIHSETKKKNPGLKALLAGIPGWEAASALYLHKLRGAKIVTPETFTTHGRYHLEGEVERLLPNSDLESTA